MRLTTLAPHWIGYGPIVVGISFWCPHCRTTRLAVLFVEAIDAEGWLAKGVTRHHDPFEWHRTGETFDTLTLRPSINCEVAGHWHGVIAEGEVTL